ncbi:MULTISPECIES: ABC transporter permease [unclassified Shinella]|jgi:peptide/nickel transport system permease protein|uniref:ABC transporter permease n=1 Tax=unclassified Shinella TaxID=2643062 RepID=UPI0006823E8D|nr:MULTISPECIES: ABC transporter permease [unclassified Shinella]KNY15846.1 ABC transporter permease [Shinella sp. SUS2]KOC75760.1 ABC transporter permease [Shinella sp. GWS1]MCO5151246.1 ABC transporter permease [Shinella sp.]MDC7265578.1 ABC transporter permease [Shinella sp. HY16]MDC7272475.1 ABC transporter permease [Shinella sp. YZ44]
MATQSLMRRLPPVSVMIAGLVLAIMLVLVLFAPLIAPMDPRDVSSYSLIDMEIPPAFMEGGDPRFLLGTDNQGRDLVSVILFGLRISVVIGLGAVLFAAAFGVVLGLVAGFFGGLVDNVVMRIADVLVSFPTILVALLISGIARAQLSADTMLAWAPLVLIFSIAINEWVQYARTVRASTMVEVARDYVRAAKVIGLPSGRIMGRHILPNVMSSVMVIATINLAGAILTEATLSFLGAGMPPTYPSLGTLIRIGNQFLFSGLWWIAVMPAAVLVILVLAVNVIGDYLRDRFNPKLMAR